MELTLTEQLRERQEMEKKLQKLAKTMDYLERAKREEAAPLIEAAYQQRLVEERILHEREQQVCSILLLLNLHHPQLPLSTWICLILTDSGHGLMQQEVELSKQRHEGDLKEKERLVRMINNKVSIITFFGFSSMFLFPYRRQKLYFLSFVYWDLSWRILHLQARKYDDPFLAIKYFVICHQISGTINFQIHIKNCCCVSYLALRFAWCFWHSIDYQEIYQERVVSHRQAEFNRLKHEREERISRILQSRRQEREKIRKLKFYLKLEEERQQKLREEEEARKREGNFYFVQEHFNYWTWFFPIFWTSWMYFFQFHQNFHVFYFFYFTFLFVFIRKNLLHCRINLPSFTDNLISVSYVLY